MVREWETLKTGEIFKNSSSKNHPNEELLSVTQDSGVIPRNMLERRVVMPDGSTKGYKLVEPGDFIISLRSFQGGLEYSSYRGIVSPAYTIIKNIRPICDDFYKHFFKSIKFINQLDSSVIGIRDGKQISYQVFKEIDIPYPPIEEQQKIAEILSSVDEAIEKTEAVIKQTEMVKKGLMQQLLTKGIGHKEFKETGIGSIPVTWEVLSLESCSDVKSGITKGRKTTNSNMQSVPYIRVANVQDGYIDLSDIKNIDATEEEIQKYSLLEGDLLLTEGGDIDKLGRGFIWNDQGTIFIHQNHVFRVRITSNLIIPKYLSYLCSSNYGKSYFLSCAKQTTNLASINSTQLKQFPVLVPPVAEQISIINVIDSIDNKLSIETFKRKFYENIKQGLMNSLLAGKIRVNTDQFDEVLS